MTISIFYIIIPFILQTLYTIFLLKTKNLTNKDRIAAFFIILTLNFSLYISEYTYFKLPVLGIIHYICTFIFILIVLIKLIFKVSIHSHIQSILMFVNLVFLVFSLGSQSLIFIESKRVEKNIENKDNEKIILSELDSTFQIINSSISEINNNILKEQKKLTLTFDDLKKKLNTEKVEFAQMLKRKTALNSELENLKILRTLNENQVKDLINKSKDSNLWNYITGVILGIISSILFQILSKFYNKYKRKLQI